MITRVGGTSVAIRVDEKSARYASKSVARIQVVAAADLTARKIHAVVEIRKALGGVTMAALLGAEFIPDQSDNTTTVEVPFGEELNVGNVKNCESELAALLVAGLPSDFADAATCAALAGESLPATWPAGLLRVDRAAFDEVGSSEAAFSLVGSILRHAMLAEMTDRNPVTAVEEILSSSKENKSEARSEIRRRSIHSRYAG